MPSSNFQTDETRYSLVTTVEESSFDDDTAEKSYKELEVVLHDYFTTSMNLFPRLLSQWERAGSPERSDTHLEDSLVMIVHDVLVQYDVKIDTSYELPQYYFARWLKVIFAKVAAHTAARLMEPNNLGHINIGAMRPVLQGLSIQEMYALVGRESVEQRVQRAAERDGYPYEGIE